MKGCTLTLQDGQVKISLDLVALGFENSYGITFREAEEGEQPTFPEPRRRFLIDLF